MKARLKVIYLGLRKSKQFSEVKSMLLSNVIVTGMGY